MRIRSRAFCGLRHWLLSAAGLPVVCFLFSSREGVAAPAAAVAVAATAAPAVSTAGRLLHDVAEIPLAAADIVKLPMGVVECALAPLPGVEFKSGLSHVGTGILGPFRLAVAVLTLPVDVANATTGVGNAVAGKK